MSKHCDIIQGIIDGDIQKKEELYRLFSAQMFTICLRYLKKQEDAEDVFQNSFIKVFEKIDQVKNCEALPGWIKTLFVYECLSFIRKNQNVKTLFIENKDDNYLEIEMPSTIIEEMSTKDILDEINKLPYQYGVVFNLYVFEGLKHKEIAEELGISVGTSKSNLHDARKLLYTRLQKLNNVKQKVV